MVAIKNIQSPKRKKTWRGDTSWHITRRQKGEDTSWHSTRRGNAPNGLFSTLYFCYSKFTHSCRVSELREVKREIQVMPPLVLLIKFVLLLIIFQASFSFNLLVANWRLSPEFWSPNIFSTRHGDQNGRSLERCNLTRPWVGVRVCHLLLLFFYVNLQAHRSAITADPPSQRMSWENCRAVPSHLLPHVLCGAGASAVKGRLHRALSPISARQLCHADEA